MLKGNILDFKVRLIDRIQRMVELGSNFWDIVIDVALDVQIGIIAREDCCCSLSLPLRWFLYLMRKTCVSNSIANILPH